MIADNDSDDRKLVTLKYASEQLGIGRQTLYKLHHDGVLEIVKIGRHAARITSRSLRAYQDNLLHNHMLKRKKP